MLFRFVPIARTTSQPNGIAQVSSSLSNRRRSSAGKPCTATLPLAKVRGCNASARSEEHTSELQSLMRISYAVFCLKKKTTISLNYTPYQILNKLTHKTNTQYKILTNTPK